MKLTSRNMSFCVQTFNTSIIMRTNERYCSIILTNPETLNSLWKNIFTESIYIVIVNIF